ncbi:TolC family protein [Taibaiella koreensis]|uniref:TolC family protein n=1 Tax=Taibaiella koreensis TaxID=1268548 RepID=UPI000E59D240|nr:TolC family protein [Taibaiella koreensis]
MKRIFCFVSVILSGIVYCKGQPGNLTLPECYQLAEEHYPLIRRYELIKRSRDYTLDNLQKGYLPQVSAYAQASYQSAVTEIPVQLPGVALPSMSKDQYKAYAQIDQLLYDGGNIKLQKERSETDAATTGQQLTADLYQLRDRINQLFFGILLTDEQLKQNALLIVDLQLGLKKVQAAVDNGTAFRSNADLISAEVLTAGQQATTLQTTRKAYTDMLSQFINRPVNESTILTIPPVPATDNNIKRPELATWDTRLKGLDVQNRLLTSSTLPKIGLFLQGGFGRPGLNMLNNSFEGYYIGGLRLSWSPSSFYTLKKKRAAIDVSRQEIAVQKETFLFNTSLTVKQQDQEMDKYQQLLASDDAIVDLRSRIKTAAMAQLEQGVITGNDFLKEVHDEDRARQNKLLHALQLLMTQYNRQTTTGNQP